MQPASDGRNRRILVIDDDRAIHAEFRQILAGSDNHALPDHPPYSVDSAFQGAEGYHKVCEAIERGEPYAAAFIDIHMPPGWDGIATLEKIWEKDASLEAVLCTTDADNPGAEVLRRFGRTDRLLILRKPFDVTQVLQLACSVTEKWHLSHCAAMKLSEVEELVRTRTLQLEQANARLRYDTLHDRLTGLANRALLTEHLAQCLQRRKEGNQRHFAVLFMDVDRFKLINDSLGHEVGDSLLKEIAHRLFAGILSHRPSGVTDSQVLAARLGGDEFVVLVDGLSDIACANAMAEHLLESLSHSYLLDEHEVYATASIGIVTSDLAGETAADVLRDADTAMYEAKAAGKGRCAVFTTAMRQRVLDRLGLESDLRRALAENQLRLFYQPIVSLVTGEVESLEALIRWVHPQRGLECSADFVKVAEETGLINPMGEWVLRTACAQFRRWRDQMGGRAPRSISVNVSRKQLLLPRFPSVVRKIVEETGIPASALHLEITETEMMQDVRSAVEVLRAIRETGVRIDIDDFGTGYSSLACLRQFPIDMLKIDRSFIANISEGRDLAAMIQAVSTLARNIGIAVVAEGIETLEQVVLLQTLDCDFGQGYFFARPMEAEAFPKFKFNPLAGASRDAA